MINWIAYAAYWLLRGLFDGYAFHRLIRLTKKPRSVQIALLKRILRDNKDSQIGRMYRFNVIRDLDEYRELVGLTTYAAIKNDLRLQETSRKYLLCAAKFVYLNHNADPKNFKAFPFTPMSLRDARRDVRMTAYAWLRYYGLWRYRVFTLIEDEPLSYSNTGLPQGTVTGFIYRNLPNFMRRRCISSPEIAAIKDAETRALAHAIIALAESNITCLVTANPATFIHLLDVINQNFDEICNVIEHGVLPEHVQRAVRGKQLLRANPRRAEQLRTLTETKNRKTFSDFWPRIRGVICWTAGSCRSSLQYLRTQLPTGIPVIELGYQS
ncbi:MAG: GH3 auxin-responsive promoter family protein, partial [Gammaproteobacteria bacterium]|nr:GH3 auxin-responsive promoter family protein [Gammaproteobacteria bacterium]